MRSSYNSTPNISQNARHTPSRSELSTALEATQRELADEELTYPDLFAEARSSKYSAKIRHEGKSLIVPLKHPPPGEISIFSFTVEDSSVIARFGSLLSTDQPHLLRAPMHERPDYEHIRMMAARVKALEWWCEYLEFILEPSSANRVRREQSQARTELAPAPQESKPEDRPPSQPLEVTTSREHTGEEKRQKKGGRKPNKTISDRNKEIETLAATGKTTLEIAKHLDARSFSVPASWTIEESDGNSYTVRNFEKAYHAPHLRKKLNGLIYDAKRCSRAIG